MRRPRLLLPHYATRMSVTTCREGTVSVNFINEYGRIFAVARMNKAMAIQFAEQVMVQIDTIGVPFDCIGSA